jgi:sodium-dependent phosphate cotransporter
LATTDTIETTNSGRRNSVRVIFLIAGALLLFLFSLEVMISSLKQLGGDSVEGIIDATSNPATGLFIGLILTAMLQSSSTTTALCVALVASGSLTLPNAVPVIMGANVGTTITSTIVSLAFIRKGGEFKRAMSAGSYHCFFNLLTVVILFPIEYRYGFLNSLSGHIAQYFRTNATVVIDETSNLSAIDALMRTVSFGLPAAWILILSFILLFISILLFRKFISGLLEGKSPEGFSRFFFQHGLKSFLWGLLTTAAIRSSTVTTSLVVPIVAKKIASLKQAAPFIMGANIGTTVTAFIAAMISLQTPGALSIAFVHLFFNLTGVLFFFPVPALRAIPIKLAEGLGSLSVKYRLTAFVFLLVTFFILPVACIYLNQK